MRVKFRVFANPSCVCEDPAFDPQSPYENRDKRFYRAILANGMSFKDYTIETFKGGADDGIVSQGGSPTGYFLRKYIQEATSFEPGKEAVWDKTGSACSRSHAKREIKHFEVRIITIDPHQYNFF